MGKYRLFVRRGRYSVVDEAELGCERMGLDSWFAYVVSEGNSVVQREAVDTSFGGTQCRGRQAGIRGMRASQ